MAFSTAGMSPAASRAGRVHHHMGDASAAAARPCPSIIALAVSGLMLSPRCRGEPLPMLTFGAILAAPLRSIRRGGTEDARPTAWIIGKARSRLRRRDLEAPVTSANTGRRLEASGPRSLAAC